MTEPLNVEHQDERPYGNIYVEFDASVRDADEKYEALLNQIRALPLLVEALEATPCVDGQCVGLSSTWSGAGHRCRRCTALRAARGQ